MRAPCWAKKILDVRRLFGYTGRSSSRRNLPGRQGRAGMICPVRPKLRAFFVWRLRDLTCAGVTRCRYIVEPFQPVDGSRPLCERPGAVRCGANPDLVILRSLWLLHPRRPSGSAGCVTEVMRRFRPFSVSFSGCPRRARSGAPVTLFAPSGPVMGRRPSGRMVRHNARCESFRDSKMQPRNPRRPNRRGMLSKRSRQDDDS